MCQRDALVVRDRLQALDALYVGGVVVGTEGTAAMPFELWPHLVTSAEVLETQKRIIVLKARQTATGVAEVSP